MMRIVYRLTPAGAYYRFVMFGESFQSLTKLPDHPFKREMVEWADKQAQANGVSYPAFLNQMKAYDPRFANIVAPE